MIGWKLEMIGRKDKNNLSNRETINYLILKEVLRTPNTDGLINWLRQPGQLRNQLPMSMRENSSKLIKICATWTNPAAETKSIGLPADALVPCFLLAT
jgi:hypothetical protein